MERKYFWPIFLLAWLIPGPGANAQDNTGIVSKVFDGDSFLLRLAPGRSVEIRLAEVDAPEKKQPFGNESRNKLNGLIGGQSVRIDIYDVDTYGRIVAHVYRVSDNLNVNVWMVERGLAWVYPKYAEDKNLFAIQDKSRSGHLGLWALPESQRIPPWKWRHRRKRK